MYYVGMNKSSIVDRFETPAIRNIITTPIENLNKKCMDMYPYWLLRDVAFNNIR